MSTRSNIVVISPMKDIKLYYRHWDGYFAGAGLDLMNKLNEAYSYRTCAEFMTPDELHKELGDYEPQPKTFYDWFKFKMDKDLRIPGDDESWENNNYEIDEDLILHGNIEYLYIIDFSSVKDAETARLFYRNLGIGNEFIKEHNRADLQSVFHYVLDSQKCPVAFRV